MFKNCGLFIKGLLKVLGIWVKVGVLSSCDKYNIDIISVINWC